MNLFQIALKNMRQRGLASLLTMLSVALGVALMVAVLLIHGVLGRQFSQSGSGYNLIIGPEGSPTQLVLSTVYRIENPIQNMPWRYYKKWAADPRVELAVPLAFGDSTEQGDFPVIGTTPQYFKLPYARTPKPQSYRIGEDQSFLRGSWDAVIGSEVARRNGWGIGSQFQLVHGGQKGEDAHVHDEKFTVVGVLQPTGTPNDRSCFVHIDGFHMLAGHENPIIEAIKREAQFFHEKEEELFRRYQPELEAEAREKVFLEKNPKHEAHPGPDVSKEVTSILIVTKGDEGDELIRSSRALDIQTALNEDTAAQAVNPVGVMDKIMRTFVTPVQMAFLGLTGLILAVSAIGIFVSIYNSMAERRREIAILRALGAQRRTVSMMILCETLLLCLGGGVLGLLLAHSLMIVTGPMLEAYTGILVNRWAVSQWELVILPVTLLVATLSGLIPSVTAYQTDVAETLAS